MSDQNGIKISQREIKKIKVAGFYSLNSTQHLCELRIERPRYHLCSFCEQPILHPFLMSFVCSVFKSPTSLPSTTIAPGIKKSFVYSGIFMSITPPNNHTSIVSAKFNNSVSLHL
jgi:hypothetical protein